MRPEANDLSRGLPRGETSAADGGRRSRRIAKYGMSIVIAFGASLLCWAGYVARLPGKERVALVVGSLGLLIAALGLVFRSRPIGMVRLGKGSLAWFWFVGSCLAAMTTWSIITGVPDLYHCLTAEWKTQEIGPVDQSETTRYKNSQLERKHGTSKNSCLFGIATLTVGVASALVLAATLRALRLQASKKSDAARKKAERSQI